MQGHHEISPLPEDEFTPCPTRRRTPVDEFATTEFLQDFPPDDGDPLVDASELDEIDLSDERWEAFLADEDELDPEPDPDDFYTFD